MDYQKTCLFTLGHGLWNTVIQGFVTIVYLTDDRRADVEDCV